MATAVKDGGALGLKEGQALTVARAGAKPGQEWEKRKELVPIGLEHGADPPK